MLIRLKRYLLRTWARFLVPFHFHQEDFHGGLQFLWVIRWGRRRWEVYDYGPNLGSDGVDILLAPLQIGTTECYDRIQNLRAAGLCRLVAVCDSWQGARDAKVKGSRHDVDCPAREFGAGCTCGARPLEAASKQRQSLVR